MMFGIVYPSISFPLLHQLDIPLMRCDMHPRFIRSKECLPDQTLTEQKVGCRLLNNTSLFLCILRDDSSRREERFPLSLLIIYVISFYHVSNIVSDTADLRIAKLSPLIPPCLLIEELPLTPEAHSTVLRGRKECQDILNGDDNRLIVVVGPCSIHDATLALDYAMKLKALAEKVKDKLLVIMRVYFEKPRTTVGWKGLINDPDLDGTFKINKGLRKARKLLLEINHLGMPVGCEFLDTISPQYTADLVSVRLLEYFLSLFHSLLTWFHTYSM